MIGAGLAYAWVDFVNKLLANDISKGDWVLAVVWLVVTVALGALAFSRTRQLFRFVLR